MAHRVAARAATDLDEIWYYVAKESSVEIAGRLIDSVTNRFLLLSTHPHLGRSREDDFGAGLRSFPVGEYVIVYCVEKADVLILRVAHGSRDIEALFGH